MLCYSQTVYTKPLCLLIKTSIIFEPNTLMRLKCPLKRIFDAPTPKNGTTTRAFYFRSTISKEKYRNINPNFQILSIIWHFTQMKWECTDDRVIEQTNITLNKQNKNKIADEMWVKMLWKMVECFSGDEFRFSFPISWEWEFWHEILSILSVESIIQSFTFFMLCFESIFLFLSLTFIIFIWIIQKYNSFFFSSSKWPNGENSQLKMLRILFFFVRLRK